MQFHLQHFIKAVVLGVFVLFFLDLHLSGDIMKYINPKYQNISKLAAGIFIVLFFVQLFRIFQRKGKGHHHACGPGCHHGHDHGNEQFNLSRLFSYSVMVFPIITGFAFEPATLNSTIASNKGSIFSQVNQKETSPLNETTLTDKENIDIYSSDHVPLINNNYLSNEEYEKKLSLLENSETIHMQEDIFGSYYEELNEQPRDYVGRTIKMSGFVFKEDGFNSNQLVVSRFMITHCIADASILGLLAEFKEANSFKEDTWLEIEGVLDVTKYGEYEIPVIKATNWKVIDEPTEPYVYPVLTLADS